MPQIDPSESPSEAAGDTVPYRARRATSAFFFVNGVVLATWASRIPAVQQHLRLSEGHLGLALLGMAVGAMPAMSVAAGIMARHGSRRVCRLAAPLMCLALPLAAVAPNGPCLFIALMLVGAGSGALNVGQNAQGAFIEKLYRRPIMITFHAVFSMGGLSGSLIGAAMAARHVTAAAHLTVVAAVSLAIVFAMSRDLLAASGLSGPSERFAFHVMRPLLSLAAIAFCTVLGEGAIADWSAVYLKHSLGSPAGVAALGYATFASMMLLGRLTGDRLAHRFGDKNLVRGSALLAGIGMGGALLLGSVPSAMIGFGCVGLGCASVYPTMVRASARLPRIIPGAAIAVISSAGYMGFFVGPPTIGLAADHVTLRWALLLVVATSLLIAALARAVEPVAHPVTEEHRSF